MTSTVYAFSRYTHNIGLYELILMNIPDLRAFTSHFDALRLIKNMPKWINHPKKARSAQLKAHINTLVVARTELPTPSDQGDPSLTLSASVESLSTSLDIEQKTSEHLKKDVKNAIQREKRAKTKVGCIALIDRSCITDYMHTQLEVLQEQVNKDLELSAQATLALATAQNIVKRLQAALRTFHSTARRSQYCLAIDTIPQIQHQGSCWHDLSTGSSTALTTRWPRRGNRAHGYSN
jgi:hypothetical protein